MRGTENTACYTLILRWVSRFYMKFEQQRSLKEIAELINASYVGDENHVITGINEIHRVEEGDIVFVDHPKYYDKALKSNATTILIDKEVECPEGKALLISKAPFDDFNKITRHFRPTKFLHDRIGEGTIIDASAVLYPNAVVGHNCTIGKNVIIHAGAVIGDHCILEDNVVVGPNTVIGHYAFYYKRKESGYDRMHTCGGVHLKEDVEVGALCTIDAGVTAMTTIGKGTKIDNQVHIGHDTIVGAHCLFAANVGLAGCVIVEDRVTLWGQVGCASDVVLGEGVTVLAQSGISKSLEAGKTYFGSPCGEVKVKFREMAAMRKLPEILERL